MLKISQLKQYSSEIITAIPEIKRQEVVVTEEELFKFLKDEIETDACFMVALVPEHGVSGSEDNAQWENLTGFFILEKTDYSEHDHETFINIFERIQEIAYKVVYKFLLDKADNTGLFCGFLAFLDEESIQVKPIKALNGCNGWYVGISFRSNF